jgi:TM2 domain-containing membrane protein YozV
MPISQPTGLQAVLRMYCSKCGSPNAENARFCASCGQAQGAPPQLGHAYANSSQSVAEPQYSSVPPPPSRSWQQPGAAAPQMASRVEPQSQPGMPQQQIPMQASPVYYQDPRVRGSAPVLMSPGTRRFAVGKSPGLAVFLSFFIPGVGQFYCGATAKGGLMLGLGFLAVFLLPVFGFGVLCLIGIRIWSMIDAYNVASGQTPLS